MLLVCEDAVNWKAESKDQNCHGGQYSKTNVMHFLFTSLGIKGLYMFRALLAYPQEALHKSVMSAGCTRVELPLQSWCSQLT
jgi:hypothetical protein